MTALYALRNGRKLQLRT